MLYRLLTCRLVFNCIHVFTRCLIGLLVSLPAFALDPAPALEPPLRIYAAASLTDVLGELGNVYEQAHPQVHIRHSFAGSSTLAQQLARGAPADIFISADQDWSNFVSQQGLYLESSRRNLLGNQLVLIAPAQAPQRLHLETASDLKQAEAFWRSFNGRLCTGATATVPVGKYARASLEYLGWWALLKPKLVETEDVRSALAFVARGECALGIVYETDAALSRAVIQVARFPAASHAAIIYPGGLLKGHSPEAASYWQFLQSAAAAQVFRRYGFVPLGADAQATSSAAP